jgi:hypothetical protein
MSAHSWRETLIAECVDEALWRLARPDKGIIEASFLIAARPLTER